MVTPPAGTELAGNQDTPLDVGVSSSRVGRGLNLGLRVSSVEIKPLFS